MTREQQVSSQPILLGLLLSQPRHGYELYQEFSRELGCVWQMGRSQLYAQLKALEEEGLLTSHTEPQPNRPPRKVYHLTSEGRETFDEWLHQPTPYLRTIRVEFLARLYFFRRLSLPGLEELVDEQKAVCRDQMWRFERIADRIDDEFRRLVLDFRRGQLEATVVWLDRCLERPWFEEEIDEA
jgi:PadR family transcriptional regulator AphA